MARRDDVLPRSSPPLWPASCRLAGADALSVGLLSVRKENAESRSLGEIGPCAASGGSILDTGRGGCRGIRSARSRGTPHERPERPVVEPQPSVLRTCSSQALSTSGKSAPWPSPRWCHRDGLPLLVRGRLAQGSSARNHGRLVDLHQETNGRRVAPLRVSPPYESTSRVLRFARTKTTRCAVRGDGQKDRRGRRPTRVGG